MFVRARAGPGPLVRTAPSRSVSASRRIGWSVSRPGKSFAGPWISGPCRSRRLTRGLDTDEQGRSLYLGYVIEAEGLRCIIAGTAWPTTGCRVAWPRSLRRALPADQRSGPARGVREHVGGRGSPHSRPRSISSFPSLRHVYLQHGPVSEFRDRGRRLPRGVAPACASLRRALGDRTVSVTLGIDIGTSGPRRSAIDERGRSSPRPRPSIHASTRGPAWSEQDRDSGGRDGVNREAGPRLPGASSPRISRGRSQRTDAPARFFFDADGQVIPPPP